MEIRDAAIPESPVVCDFRLGWVVSLGFPFLHLISVVVRSR